MDTATWLQGINVYLIGMMGSGKTTIGQRFAEALEYRYFDTDQLIETAAKQPVTQIFAESGEPVFRELETNTLQALSSMTRCTIATGGGIILKPENWGYLRNGVIVWLDVPVDVLYDRLQADTTRPLLQQGDLREQLEILDASRRSIYSQADIHLPITATDTPAQIATRGLTLIAQACEAKAKEDDQIQRMNADKPFTVN
ncbi:shikimate kinase [filamentous cyanobacterium LEGE 11480]|uniref:Shikimate kinase n=1 Tax=Romeriopsis navalis LEGE 11480 TaxID=2777977 RepID=A0A928VMX0_9CYAN|nr:shikimate kinase [Romeriopsis navalis]MBE9029440.1 shikimate kinase [Romeriopsis navalis LEGE 11480]